MKINSRRLVATLFAMLFLFPFTSRAFVTTTLLSQNFSSSTFPPTGWSCSYLGEYNYYYGGWFWSSGGKAGSNGSAVAATCYTYQPGCYTGYNNGTITMTTPAISTGSLPKADSMFLDFDLWYPEGYYQMYISPYQENQVIVSVGTTVLLTKKSPGDCSFYSGGPFTDPSSYPNTGWVHYHVYVPNQGATTQITFTVKDNGNYCYYGFMYCENVAFDNIVVTNNHYDVITLSGPNSLNFGAIPYLQTSSPLYTYITNNSSRTFTLSNYQVTGTNPGDFTIIRAPSFIPVGGKDSIGVIYTPHASGTRTANLTFSTNDDVGTTGNIQLNGYGLRPFIALPPFQYSMFAHVHTRFGATATASLLVTNTGQVPLHISPSSTITGDYSQMYTITRLPATILPDQTDSIIIVFAPTIEGLMSAQLNIVSDANNGTQVMPLDGIGILARLTMNNAYMNNISMNYDSVAVGVDSCFSITLFNPGSDTLAIEKNFFSSADPDFTMTALTGTDTLIAPGAAKVIPVCFLPLKRGYRTAELRIVTNIPKTYTTPVRDTSQFTVTFIGTGVPTGNFQITGPDSTYTTVLGTSICQTDTLWNVGQASLTVTSLTAADSAEFIVNPPTLPLVLPAGGSQTFTVCADPAVMGNRMTTLTGIGMAGEKMDTATLPLSVFGQSICTSDTIMTDFPQMTCVSDSSTATINVTNCGNVATPYTVSLAGANAADFKIVSPLTSPSESAGGMASFMVSFYPTTNQPETATLNIAGGAGGSVQLSATGSAAAIADTGTAPTTELGQTSNFSVTVQNKGNCDWTPGNVSVSAPFAYVSGGTTPIPANGTGTLNFTFTPTTDGPATQTVMFSGSTGVSIPAANVTLSGNGTSASVAEVTAAQGYSLEQNYPNPFAGTSQVEITLPVTSDVRLVVIDVKGQTVQTVLNKRMAAGTFEVSIDASKLAAGTYYYQMTAGNVTLTRHMTIE